MSVILGIDPGSRISGYGVIEFSQNRYRYIASGRIRLTDSALAPRLEVLFNYLSQLIKEHNPDAVAVEQVFVGKSASSALKLGHARGIALLAPQLASVPVYEYAARAIKQAVTGTGAASKEQVQSMVARLLELDASPASDAADALAVALCHAHSFKLAALRKRSAAQATDIEVPTAQ